MRQEDKELLLKDLCARLPYKVKYKYYDCYEGDYYEGIICGFEQQEYIQINGGCLNVEEVKPYLFPLSSMTKEQKREYEDALTYHDYVKGGWTIAKSVDDEYIIPYWFVDWCNKNHFDYRGLIPMGLAIDCTNLNIY